MIIITALKKFYLQFQIYILIIGGAIGAWFIAKSMGRKEQMQENYKDKMKEHEKIAAVEIVKQNKQNEAVVKAVTNSNEIKNENATLSDDAAINKLRDKWTRD